MKIIALLVVCLISDAFSTDYEFSKEFMFGASTAAYQIEGGWNEDGKGENIWDYLVHTRPELIKDRSNGDIACDSYHKYKEDIALLKDLNLKFYRFSISWARIVPSGEVNKLNPEGIAFYNRLIDELIANDVVPFVTMYHWDMPQYLQELGGWANPIMASYFEEFARVLFTHYGDRVKWWITINEPKEICKGYAFNMYAPYLHLNYTGYYLAAHTQLIAHGKVYRLYEKMFKSKQQGKISISINGVFFMPKNESSSEDVQTAERANQFERGWLSHPIYKGDYPPIMRQWVDKKSKQEGRPWSRLPTFSEEEIKLINGSSDFYALNHYSSRLVTRGSDPNRSFNLDADYATSVNELWPKSVAPWIMVAPEGLRKQLVWLKNEYGNPPMIITENGFADNGQLDDSDRINYLKGYLNATLHAIVEDHCDVIGYTVWSLLDNFEWLEGYSAHFGIVKVNFSDPQRSRIPKASYTFYKNVVTARNLIDSHTTSGTTSLLKFNTMKFIMFSCASFMIRNSYITNLLTV